MARRVYLSGPMSGKPNFGYDVFNAEAARLRALGYAVYNPTEHHSGDLTLPYAQYMRTHLAALLGMEMVATLPGWSESPGAVLEVNIAKCLGMTVTEASTLASPQLPLIGLSGYAGSGKTTAANFLARTYGYQPVALADALRGEVYTTVSDVFASFSEFHLYVEEHKRDDPARNSAWARQLLQAWASYRRDCCGEDYWLKQIPLHGGIVVSDVRYPNEVTAIQARGGVVWRIDRIPSRQDEHASESHIAKLRWDTRISNTSTEAEFLAALGAQHRALMNQQGAAA